MKQLARIGLGIVAVLALVVGCGDDEETGPVLELVVYTPDGLQIPPTQGLEIVRVSALANDGGTVLTRKEFSYSTGGGGLDSIPYGDSLQIAVEGVDALGTVIQSGMTAPFKFGPDSNNLQLPLFFSQVNGFSPATALRFDEVVGNVPQEVRFQRQGRGGHGQVMLSDGLLVFTGGAILSTEAGVDLPWVDGGLKIEDVLDSVEIYDPKSGYFSERPGMVFPRAFHTTTLLADGRILVVGGITLITKDDGSVVAESLSSAEAFDPSRPSMPWELIAGAASGLDRGRAWHTATLRRADGRVVVVGGREIAGGEEAVLATAEVFDPSTNKFLDDAEPITMADPRTDHDAVLLTTGLGAGGTILVIGGRNETGALDTTEALRLVGSGGTKSVFSSGPRLVSARYGHVSVKSSAEGGKLILAIGGIGTDGDSVAGIEILDAESGDDFGEVDLLNSPRAYPTVVELPRTHDLIVIGGYDAGGPVGQAERIAFQGGGSPFSTVEIPSSLALPRYLHQTAILDTGLLLITGGVGSRGGEFSSYDEAEFFNADDGPLGSSSAVGPDPDTDEPDFL